MALTLLVIRFGACEATVCIVIKSADTLPVSVATKRKDYTNMTEHRKQDILKNLKQDALDTVSFFKSLDAADLNKQVYDHGAAWDVKQVLAHLITIEYSMQKLFKNILEGGSGAPGDFDLERYNRSQPLKLVHLSKEKLLDRFKETRSKTVQMVENMQEEDLYRTGNHAYHGFGTLERFIRWAYEHTQHHIDVIKETIE